jgi:hypothetical protein
LQSNEREKRGEGRGAGEASNGQDLKFLSKIPGTKFKLPNKRSFSSLNS